MAFHTSFFLVLFMNISSLKCSIHKYFVCRLSMLSVFRSSRSALVNHKIALYVQQKISYLCMWPRLINYDRPTIHRIILCKRTQHYHPQNLMQFGTKRFHPQMGLSIDSESRNASCFDDKVHTSPYLLTSIFNG